jgi:hypothetical protein
MRTNANSCRSARANTARWLRAATPWYSQPNDGTVSEGIRRSGLTETLCGCPEGDHGESRNSTLKSQAEHGIVAADQNPAGDLHRLARQEVRSARGMTKFQRLRSEFAEQQWPDKSHSAHNREEVAGHDRADSVTWLTTCRQQLSDDNTPPYSGAVLPVQEETIRNQARVSTCSYNRCCIR